MRKLLYLTTFILSSLVFLACSDDNVPEPQGPEDPPEEYESWVDSLGVHLDHAIGWFKLDSASQKWTLVLTEKDKKLFPDTTNMIIYYIPGEPSVPESVLNHSNSGAPYYISGVCFLMDTINLKGNIFYEYGITDLQGRMVNNECVMLESREEMPAFSRSASYVQNRLMNIYVHVLRDGFGNGWDGQSVSQTILSSLNQGFSTSNISFVLSGWSYIDCLTSDFLKRMAYGTLYRSSFR
ncbi:MAG: hypothetical protein LIO90_04740 [Bacteroidales bacterium]|nr:hypothetical protein [Bacteroidales bacterium]